jgi:hypothetical protein
MGWFLQENTLRCLFAYEYRHIENLTMIHSTYTIGEFPSGSSFRMPAERY